jgi:hypothetical protein
VGIGRPRVGQADAFDQRSQLGAGGGPHAERAVDVRPGALVLAGEGHPAGDRVEGSGVHVTGLQADDERRVRWDLVEDRRQPFGAHAALLIGLDHMHAVSTHAEVLERGVDGAVCLGADHHLDLRCVEQAAGSDVPAGPLERRLPRRREAGEVCHLAAGHQAVAGVGRQAEEVDQPLADGSSTTDAAGPATYSPAFWSQAEVSQSAATAAGRAPPMTKPK